MKKRFSASGVMRIVSILGIILLLALQYVWWGNAYRAVEMDMLSKSEECLRGASEDAIMYQLDSTRRGIRFVNEAAGEKVNTKFQKVSMHFANNTTELKFLLDDVLNNQRKSVNETLINKYLSIRLKNKLGFVPDHSLFIQKESTELSKTNSAKYNRSIIGNKQDTILQQLGYKSYIVLIIQSPINLFSRP